MTLTTAVHFVRLITAVVVTITSKPCWDAYSCVVALELVASACCTHKRTRRIECRDVSSHI